MTNKLVLLPLLALKLKTALAIKTGLSLFGLGLAVGCLLSSSSSGGESKVGTQTKSDESPTTKAVTGRKSGQ